MKSPNESFNFGVYAQIQGRHKEAVVHFQKAVNLGLKDVALYNNLGLALMNLGQLMEAASTLKLALSIEPEYVHALLNLGMTVQAMGQYDEAKQLYWQVLAKQPDNVDALSNLGDVLRIQGMLDEAEEYLKRGLALQPNHVGLIGNLGVVFNAKNRFEDAANCFNRILSIYPRNLIALNNLGATMFAQGRLDIAEDCYKQALCINPENADTLNNIGVLMLNQGNLIGAEENLKRAISIKPDFTKAYFHYVQTRKITRDDNQLIAHLEGMTASSELSSGEKSDVNFALGKCYDDRGEYEKAFLNFKNGHRLEEQRSPFNPARHIDEVNKLIETFNKEFYFQRAAFGSHSKVPIFIVGMPRSGTTLVEQIISSHPDVFGAGELYFMDSIRNEISLGCINQLTQQEVLIFANRYETYLRSFSSSALYVTDKMPQNFLHLGLVRLCFPNARIIHCKRDPLDTCLSIYTQKFATDHPYAHTLENMASYYTQYIRLMQHWKNILPGSIFEIQYEKLVTDPEVTTKNLLEFCNITMDELPVFNRNNRVVNTASSWQVRQPMYSSSIGRWKRYQSFLEPLMQLEH